MQPERDGRVLCGAWSGRMVILSLSTNANKRNANEGGGKKCNNGARSERDDEERVEMTKVQVHCELESDAGNNRRTQGRQQVMADEPVRQKRGENTNANQNEKTDCAFIHECGLTIKLSERR